MSNPIEAVKHFCLIQLEIIKGREYKLRKEIEDCKIQSEFLLSILKEVGEDTLEEPHTIEAMIKTRRNWKDD
jgi:hypothetical protein